MQNPVVHIAPVPQLAVVQPPPNFMHSVVPAEINPQLIKRNLMTENIDLEMDDVDYSNYSHLIYILLLILF